MEDFDDAQEMMRVAEAATIKKADHEDGVHDED